MSPDNAECVSTNLGATGLGGLAPDRCGSFDKIILSVVTIYFFNFGFQGLQVATTRNVYYKQNRLKQLRAFCQAARTGSISRAAEKLFLSQPSVSLQIQALERELDTTLFERRGPTIRLTPEGAVLAELAQPLVDGIDSLSETFSAAKGDLTAGALNIAAGESTILYILPDPISNFAETHPGIDLKLHNVTGRDGLAMIRADEADFAVGSMLEVPDDIDYYPIFEYNPVLIASKDHPLAAKKSITLEDISPYGLVLPPRHLTTWRVVELVFKQYNVDYQVAMEAGGWEVIKTYVKLGLGVSIVTDICMTQDTDGLISHRLDRYFPKRSYGIVMRRGKFMSPQSKAFLQTIDKDFDQRKPARQGATIALAT